MLNCLGLTDIILRSRTITHQVGRQGEIQTSRTNGHPKFSQTSPSKQRSSVQLSETVAGTGGRNVGIDEMDCSTRSLAHSWFQKQRCTVPVQSCDRWSVSWKSAGFGESVLAHLPEVGKGSGNPAPKLADRWKSAVWLGRSDFTDEHLVRTDEGVECARSVRRLAEHSWSEENLPTVVETPQKPKSTTLDIPLAAEPYALNLQYQKWMKARKTNPQRSQRETVCSWSHQRQRWRLKLRAQAEARNTQKHRRPLP